MCMLLGFDEQNQEYRLWGLDDKKIIRKIIAIFDQECVVVKAVEKFKNVQEYIYIGPIESLRKFGPQYESKEPNAIQEVSKQLVKILFHAISVESIFMTVLIL